MMMITLTSVNRCLFDLYIHRTRIVSGWNTLVFTFLANFWHENTNFHAKFKTFERNFKNHWTMHFTHWNYFIVVYNIRMLYLCKCNTLGSIKFCCCRQWFFLSFFEPSILLDQSNFFGQNKIFSSYFRKSLEKCFLNVFRYV